MHSLDASRPKLGNDIYSLLDASGAHVQALPEISFAIIGTDLLPIFQASVMLKYGHGTFSWFRYDCHGSAECEALLRAYWLDPELTLKTYFKWEPPKAAGAAAPPLGKRQVIVSHASIQLEDLDL